MYKFIKSTGGSFAYPSSLADITLKEYIDYLSFVDNTKPKELKDLEDASIQYQRSLDEKDKATYDSLVSSLTDVIMYRKIYPFYARVVAHFAKGITEQEILGGKKHGDGMNLGNLQHLYNLIVQILIDPEEPEYTPILHVDNELWYLPQRFMEKSKLIEYAEASQFEANLQDLENGNLLALPKIMCVLVRKEGEMYSDKLLKREEMFNNWSLENCFKVGFFLLKRSEISILSLTAYMAAQDLTKLRLESNN
jgi:hypothetical protein